MAEIYKETARRFIHRHMVVGTSSAKLNNNTDFIPWKGILLRAPGAFDPKPNIACVWVGGAAVTADSAQATGGMPIAPGESLHIPSDLIEGDIYLVSTDNDQDIAWIGYRMAQTTHTSVSSPTGEATQNVADTNVTQLLIEAVLALKKIEYHLALITDTDLSNTEF